MARAKKETANGGEQHAAAQPAPETGADMEIAELFDELDLPAKFVRSEIEAMVASGDPKLDIVVSALNSKYNAQFRTRMHWYLKRAKAGKNEFRNEDGTPNLDAIRANYISGALEVERETGNTLREEAATNVLHVLYERHNAAVKAGGPGIFTGERAGKELLFPAKAKGASAVRDEQVAWILSTAPTHATLGPMLEEQVAAIKAKRAAAREAAKAAAPKTGVMLTGGLSMTA